MSISKHKMKNICHLRRPGEELSIRMIDGFKGINHGYKKEKKNMHKQGRLSHAQSLALRKALTEMWLSGRVSQPWQLQAYKDWARKLNDKRKLRRTMKHLFD